MHHRQPRFIFVILERDNISGGLANSSLAALERDRSAAWAALPVVSGSVCGSFFLHGS